MPGPVWAIVLEYTYSLLEPSFQAKAKRACFVEAVREWLLCAGKGKTLDEGDNKLENKDLIAAAVTVLYRPLPHYLCPTAALLQIPLLLTSLVAHTTCTC